jgi:hypothetical protein
MNKMSVCFVAMAVAFPTLLFAVPSEDNCRLKFTYIGEGTYTNIECAGTCAQGACSDDSASTPTQITWFCECDGSSGHNTRCRGTLTRHLVDDPVEEYTISCVRNGCGNECTSPKLPTAQQVPTWACTCPDA